MRRTVAALLGALLTSAVFGQSPPARAFPERPVRLIVPYPPGGGSDVMARILAPKMSEGLGQQVVIDNRAGAATIIGLDLLAKSPPDGYTFGIATSTLAVNATLNKSIPFDTLRDFAPVMHAADGLYVLVVHPGVPAKTGAAQVDRLNAELRKALAHPEVKRKLLEFGADAVASTPAEFGAFLRAEVTKWGKVVREQNIQPE